ncbi:transposase [Sphingomonas sp. PP-CE-3G-477]|uniref:transposase n=1 Tax=Sphingomonas sp. PP-CE-3G-477 TaxID=2135660 RepID=UPI0011B1DBE3|nr:transposase [Sphingomonas sp. PP-CE-3G-477]
MMAISIPGSSRSAFRLDRDQMRSVLVVRSGRRRLLLFEEQPMPTERIAMRKVREILRLTYDAGLPSREVARRVGVGSTGVRMMLQRFRASKLEWPLADGLTDTALELELYGVAAKRGSERGRHEPDWAVVNRELKRKHVTLQLLWDEYIEAHPDGYRYSRFCELYRSWEGRLPVTMRQTHLGGDRMFVDYAGDTVSVVVDRLTGEIREAHLFVAVMGASSLSFAWPTWTETLPDWTDAHVRAFDFFGGASWMTCSAMVSINICGSHHP